MSEGDVSEGTNGPHPGIEGRVAIVTGAAQGIGAVYAKALAAAGAKLVVADVLDATPVAQIIQQAGGEAVATETDVTDAAAVEAMVATAVETYGQLDILVANAAIFAQLDLKPFTEIDVEEWDRVMAVNVRGPFLCARAAVPEMRKNGYGRIINIASGTVFKGTPQFLHYVTSKGAVVALTRSLAREVGGDGICVNTLAPGFVMSDGVLAHPTMRDSMSAAITASRAIKREQDPEDLIGPLLLLASEEARFMTGQVVVVDGGSVTH
jgi:NAD(P)-dependent dehydrogenase (short-subunit alcohol dehydrogenase family)